MILVPLLCHSLTCLFSSGPKGLCDVGGQRAPTNRCRLPVLCDLDGLKLVHPDLDSALHPPDCADGAMAAIDSKEWYIGARREFHLREGKSLHPETNQRFRDTYGLCNVVLSAWNNNDADGRSFI